MLLAFGEMIIERVIYVYIDGGEMDTVEAAI
jgi:hypothetical protein